MMKGMLRRSLGRAAGSGMVDTLAGVGEGCLKRWVDEGEKGQGILSR
jgi:hypothetical protein